MATNPASIPPVSKMDPTTNSVYIATADTGGSFYQVGRLSSPTTAPLVG